MLVLPAAAKAPGTTNGQIVYGNNNGLFIVNPDGTDQHLLQANACCASWSPDGNQIAFAASTNDGRITTATISPDGSGYTLLPLPDSTLNLGPAAGDSWSPDGNRYALQGWDNTDPSRSGVYTAGTDGSGLVRVTTGNDLPADWSPDGTRIVFFRQDPNRTRNPFAVFVVGANGGPVHQISAWQPDVGTASWSPDGQWILTDDGRGRLYGVHPDGTGRHLIPLAVGSRYAAFTPSWSPDGTKIAFGLVKATGPGTTQGGIYTANADGSDLQQMTASALNQGLRDDTPDWGTHPPTG